MTRFCQVSTDLVAGVRLPDRRQGLRFSAAVACQGARAGVSQIPASYSLIPFAPSFTNIAPSRFDLNLLALSRLKLALFTESRSSL